jgi:segregation and condensation protein B
MADNEHNELTPETTNASDAISAAALTEEAPAVPESILQENSRESGNEPSARSTKKESLNETLRILEAVLFASDEILTIDRIKSIVPGQPDARKIRHMIDTLNVQLQKERHPFEIIEAAGGYQFRTVSYYYPWVSQLFKEKAAKKLSIQSLECLAIIAYKQPITKAEIEAVRGVLSDGAMKTLLEKRLVTIIGRSEKAGRPLLYATTKDFLSYFGLNKLTDLPNIGDFEALAKEKLGELTETELTTISDTPMSADDAESFPMQPEEIAETDSTEKSVLNTALPDQE